MFGGTPDDRHQLVVAERLLDVVERARVHRLHRRLQRRLCGHEDDRHVGVMRPRGREHLHAGHLRHADVAQHDVRREPRDHLERGLSAVRQVGREALGAQEDLEGLEDARLVVDDEDGGRGDAIGHGAIPDGVGSTGRNTVKPVPLGVLSTRITP